MNGLKLLATGRCLPKTAVSNEEMSRWVDTSDEWIASRTGIRQRYFCGEGETALTLAAGAARQALARSGINIRMIAQGSEELDIVVGVDVDDFERAIRVIYGAFVDSDDNIITVEEAEEEATNE